MQYKVPYGVIKYLNFVIFLEIIMKTKHAMKLEKVRWYFHKLVRCV